jgi:hypothetical protein
MRTLSNGLNLFPEEVLVDLLGANQILQLLQPRKSTRFKHLLGHINLGENVIELLRATLRIPLALEAGKLSIDFLEGNPVAAVIRTVLTKA